MEPLQSAVESAARPFYDFSISSIITAVIGCSLGLLYYFSLTKKVVTNATWYALTTDALSNSAKAREQWNADAKELLYGGLKKIKGAIAVMSPTGPTIFLPNTYAHEIRNMKELSFGANVSHEWMSNYKGLTPIKLADYHDLVQDVVRNNLTRSLDVVTLDINDEADSALREMLGDIPEWKTLDLKDFVYRYVGRISTRVFLGPELADNEEWLDIAVSYAANAATAVYKLRATNPLWRPFASWWMPELQLCQRQVARAREIIHKFVQDRLKRKANGDGTEKTSDMISWIDDKARTKGVKVDIEDVQLLLTIGGINTTAETLAVLMGDLMENPETISKLREEMVSSLSTHGWTKTSLSSMELLDSAMKESQRLHPLTDTYMPRLAKVNTTLPDGTIIPKNYKTGVAHRFEDPVLYPNPTKFEPDRFLKLRSTDKNKWLFVTGSPEHLGFGLGSQICPGRFFVSNQLKVTVTNFLIKYDWKFSDEGRLPLIHHGADYIVDGREKVMVKSRKVEIHLNNM